MKSVDLVLEGGGTKIPALVGAVERLHQLGWEIQQVAGSSAGAIVASLIAAGYTPSELKQIVLDIDFSDFKNGSAVTNLPKLFNKFGYWTGNSVLSFMRKMLEVKNVVTFEDLKKPLKVMAADLTYADIAIFPDHSRIYGIEPDDMEVALAVRASMAIPLVFEPVKLNGRYLVDGGTVSNFPIWVFDRIEPRYPTFGILLKENDFHTRHKITSFIEFAYATIKTATQGREKIAIHPGDFVVRTIPVDVGASSSLNFNMTSDEKLNLIKAGAAAVDKFLSTWSWEKYLKWRKVGKL